MRGRVIETNARVLRVDEMDALTVGAHQRIVIEDAK